MSEVFQYDLIVIGAGPGGYVAAIRGAQLGMKVAVVEKRQTPGGVCLNEGCIPSKALLDSTERFISASTEFSRHGIEIAPPVLNLSNMLRRKEQVVKKLTDGISYLFNKNEITLHVGAARLIPSDLNEMKRVLVSVPRQRDLLEGYDLLSEAGEEMDTVTLEATSVILATGSEPTLLAGIAVDRQVVVTAREALSFDTVPEHLVIAGGGYIGLELGSVWQRLGSKVTVMEMLPNISPQMDRQVSEGLYRMLRKQGVQFKLGTRITAIRRIGSKAIVQYNDGTGSEEMDCDRVLVAVGRKPLTAAVGIEELGIVCDAKGRVVVDENYQTSIPGIYAIGDLIAGPMLAHKASREGTVCVERMNGQQTVVEYDFIPSVCYTSPEAASVGKTEEELKESAIPYKTGCGSFSASGRARCMDATDGFVKIITHAVTDRILGVHILGLHASEMIAEAVCVMSFGGTARDLALICHAHPTLSETLHEAALDALGKAVHR